MGYKVIPCVEIKNTGNQLVVVYVKDAPNSTIYPRSGQTHIQMGSSIVVEESRVDLQQLTMMRNKKKIETNFLNKIEPAPATGSTGATF